MACRIGITTDTEKRKAYWKSQHPTLKDWRIIKVHKTKTEAQAAETKLSKRV